MLVSPFLILFLSLAPSALGVIGGEDFPVYNYPWLISIRYRNRHHCAGFLYKNGFAITAAHCIPNKENEWAKYLVVAREHNLRCEEGYEEIRTIHKVHHHPSYNQQTIGTDDVAVIQLEQGNPFPNDIDLKYPDPYQIATTGFPLPPTATLVGWGRTIRDLKLPQSTNLYPTRAELKLINRLLCRRRYPSGKPFNIGSICFGNETTSGCMDDGAPLMCGQVICGIFTEAPKCGDNDQPGIFQDMGVYAQFIENVIHANSDNGRLITTKDAAGVNVTTCGGHYETTHGNIKLQGLPAGQKCHFAIQTPNTEMTINLKESTMKDGDNLIITEFCGACPCERVNILKKVDTTDLKLQASLIMVVVAIGKSDPSQPRGFTMTFNSTGYPSHIPTLTGFTVLNTSTSGSYSHPTTAGKYGNNEVSLVVFDPPEEMGKYTSIVMKEIDIEGEGYDEECSYDAVSVYKHKGDSFKRLTRVCGRKPPKPMKIDGGYGIMSMITDDETVGNGFSFDYNYS